MARNPWLAAALSFVVSGLGQIYNREYGKGLAFVLIELLTGYGYYQENLMAAGAINVAVNLYAIWDAYAVAKKSLQGPKTEAIQPIQPEPTIRVF